MNPYPKRISVSYRYLFLSTLIFISANLHAVIIDFGVSEIIAPVSGCGLGEEEYIVVEIKNYGDVSIAGYPVSFQVDGGTVYTEMEVLPLEPGDSTINYFGIPVDFSTPGFYTICAWTDAPDDNPYNDSVCIVIESFATPTIEFGPDLSVCGTQLLDAGNPGSTYLWNTGATSQTISADTSGDYSVTITNPETGCTATDEIEITIVEPPVSDFNYSLADLTCTFTNASLNCDTYNWDFGDGSTSALKDPVHVYSETGAYDVSLSATNICNTDIMVKTLTWPLAIQTKDELLIRISPNPAETAAYIIGISRPMQVQIVNYLGEIVYRDEIHSMDQEIYLSDISSGVYAVFLIEKNQMIAVEKLVVQK